VIPARRPRIERRTDEPRAYLATPGPGSVVDYVAIEFAAGVYRAIADGESVAIGFRLGRNRLALVGLDTRDPVLIGTPSAAERVFITG